MAFTPLSEETDFSFPSGVFDVRGWELRTMKDGEKVGEIEDLLVDDTGTIRYLDVDLQTLRKHVLVPTARTRIDEAEQVVWVPGMSRDQLEDVPRYDHDPHAVTAEYEDRLDAAYGGSAPAHLGERRPHVTEPGGLRRYDADITPRSRAMPTRPLWSGPLANLSVFGEYEVAPGDIDPRGWDVVLADQRRAGTVHDLVIEPSALKVRYLDCELTISEHGHPSGGRHILIPIGYTRLETGDRTVYVDAITSEALADLPSFSGLPLAPENEDRIYQVFSRRQYREGE